jgi:hypothetical protein
LSFSFGVSNQSTVCISYVFFQNVSVAHPASYPMGTGGYFPGGKAAGAWSWPLTSIKCRGQECLELCLHSPNTSSWRGA